jgi:hypothetical protein
MIEFLSWPAFLLADLGKQVAQRLEEKWRRSSRGVLTNRKRLKRTAKRTTTALESKSRYECLLMLLLLLTVCCLLLLFVVVGCQQNRINRTTTGAPTSNTTNNSLTMACRNKIP